jgi:hypothetical protein
MGTSQVTGSPRNARTMAIPSISGITMSWRINVGRIRAARRSASRGSLHTWRRMSRSPETRRAMVRPGSGSSSTISTVIGRGGARGPARTPESGGSSGAGSRHAGNSPGSRTRVPLGGLGSRWTSCMRACLAGGHRTDRAYASATSPSAGRSEP